MPGLTPWDFVPPVSPIELRSGNRMHKLKTALSKYWTDHDKFIALVMAGSGIIFACVGGVLISLGLGLPLAIFLSYRRSATDIYTNARIVVHDLIKYPKYAHQVLALLQKVEHEEQIKSQEAENCDQTSCRKEETTEEKEDVFSSKMKEIKFQTRFAGDQLFPLNLVVLAKPLNPNNKEDVRVIGYLCVDHIGRICSEETQTEVEQLIENNDIETNEFLAESQKLGVHYDLLKRERKDLFAYTFGSVCILKTMVVAPEFRGNNLGKVMFAYAMQKLRKIAEVDILICKRNKYIEDKLMDPFYGRYYNPPDFCLENESLHQALRTQTIFFPVYKSKLDYACESALDKFLMFEKLKKNTIPYFTKSVESNYCLENKDNSSVAIVGTSSGPSDTIETSHDSIHDQIPL